LRRRRAGFQFKASRRPSTISLDDIFDARNRELGKAGERFVVAFECDRLRRAGREDLANDVRWVSDLDGDGFFLIAGSVIALTMTRKPVDISQPSECRRHTKGMASLPTGR
jgi:hypothetical protein